MDYLTEIFTELRIMRTRIEGVEGNLEILIRADQERIERLFWEQADNDDLLARVYLLVDGKRSQNDISLESVTNGSSKISIASVSERLQTLKEQKLIVLITHTKRGKFYRRSDIDHILGLGRKLEKRRARKPMAEK